MLTAIVKNGTIIELVTNNESLKADKKINEILNSGKYWSVQYAELEYAIADVLKTPFIFDLKFKNEGE